MLQRLPGLYYAPSDLHGRGVFCTHAVHAGDIIEICPVIVLPETETEWLKESVLYQYYFSWGEDLKSSAIALGYASLYNHAEDPNAEFIPDDGDDTIVIRAQRDIRPGEEITVDYHSGATHAPLWFRSKK